MPPPLREHIRGTPRSSPGNYGRLGSTMNESSGSGYTRQRALDVRIGSLQRIGTSARDQATRRRSQRAEGLAGLDASCWRASHRTPTCSTTSPAAKASPARRIRPSRTFGARSNSRSGPARTLKAIPTSIRSARTRFSRNCSHGDFGSATAQHGPPDGMRARYSSSARLPVLASRAAGTPASRPPFRFPACISESQSPAPARGKMSYSGCGPGRRVRRSVKVAGPSCRSSTGKARAVAAARPDC